MSTVRVYELAKELNVSNKEVLDFLSDDRQQDLATMEA